MRDGISEPALAKGFPVANVNVACAKDVPHGHLVGARVGGGDDADQVVLGNPQQAFGLVNGKGQAGLAQLGTVRTTESGLVQCGNVVAWALLAWA